MRKVYHINSTKNSAKMSLAKLNSAPRVNGSLIKPMSLSDPTLKPATTPVRTKKKKKLKRVAVQAGNDLQSGYAFVVQVQEDTGAVWRFVDFSYGITLRPNSVFSGLLPNVTQQMREFWKRAVIDNTFSWESGYPVDPKSLRLIRVTLGAEDATQLLFDDPDDMREKQKLAALSRLTDEEAQMLNVDRKHTIMRLVQNRNASPNDEAIADVIRDDNCTEIVNHVFRIKV